MYWVSQQRVQPQYLTLIAQAQRLDHRHQIVLQRPCQVVNLIWPQRQTRQAAQLQPAEHFTEELFLLALQIVPLACQHRIALARITRNKAIPVKQSITLAAHHNSATAGHPKAQHEWFGRCWEQTSSRSSRSSLAFMNRGHRFAV